MLKVAFYAPLKPPHHPTPSGDRKVARLLLAALKTGGSAVEVASSLRSWSRDGTINSPAALAPSVEIEVADLRTHYEKQGPPDIWFTYHLYHKAPDLIGPAISSALGIPYILAEASVAPKQSTGPWKQGYACAVDAVGRADCVFSLNPNDLNCLRPHLKEAVEPIDLKPFLDTQPYTIAARDRARVRSDLGQQFDLNPKRPWVLITAMMRNDVKLQSYRVAADAMRQVSAHFAAGEGPEIILMGDGPARTEVEAAFANMGAHITGLVPEARVPEIQTACDLAFWPSIGEAFGLGVLEAQAAGMPVVAGDLPGVANMVQNGTTAILCPPDDPAAQADALLTYLSDPDRRARDGAAAAAHVAEYHSLRYASETIMGGIRSAMEAAR